MLELNIRGRDVQELYVNGVNMLMLLTRGGHDLFKPQTPAEPVVQAEPEVNPQVDAPPAANPSKRGKRSVAPTIELKAEPDPLGLDATPAEPARELTLEDIKQRVQDVLHAHGPVSPENPNGRGNSMNDCIAYVRRLFEPFGIKKAIELKPERFGEFMTASQVYLDGTAK